MKKHTYRIDYDVKKNGSQYGRRLYVKADTAKEAKEVFKNTTNGKCFYNPDCHAFHVEVHQADNEIIAKQYDII